MRATFPGEVAWYATGRFYIDEAGSIFDVGYFLHLQGLQGSLFDGERSESTAHFTFHSQPFQSKSVANADLSIGIDTVGEFSLYLNRVPSASFDEPESFGAGERIATFRRVSIVAGLTVPNVVIANVFSASLIWSTEFEYAGERQNLSELLPNGVTQWGTAGTIAITPPPPKYTTVLPFVGSAIAIGA
ncbi:MAG TPA: hypothetical protein VN605_07685 [Thermoanaerobaculia bacterium]|nr:hypothetical protein [Thermoanaerobaculia bacterium]